jgi:hypothetical protein
MNDPLVITRTLISARRSDPSHLSTLPHFLHPGLIICSTDKLLNSARCERVNGKGGGWYTGPSAARVRSCTWYWYWRGRADVAGEVASVSMSGSHSRSQLSFAGAMWATSRVACFRGELLPQDELWECRWAGGARVEVMALWFGGRADGLCGFVLSDPNGRGSHYMVVARLPRTGSWRQVMVGRCGISYPESRLMGCVVL